MAPLPYVDIFNMVYQQILRIPPEVVSHYSTVQDQLLYLILIPHVLLILFILAFSYGVVGKVIGQHRGLSNLVAIVTYIYIIMAGWYGNYLIGITQNIFILALLVGFLLFFSSFILHPARWPDITKQATNLAQMAGQATFGKGAERKAAEESLNVIKKQLRNFNVNNPRSAAEVQAAISNNPRAATAINLLVMQYEELKAKLK